VEKLRLPVFIDAFVAIFAQAMLQLGQTAALEKAIHPAIEYQLLMKTMPGHY
jgi:hypothetical protein